MFAGRAEATVRSNGLGYVPASLADGDGLLGHLIRNRVHVVAGAAAAVWGWRPLVGPAVLSIDPLIVALAVFCIYQSNRLTDAREDSVNCPSAFRTAGEHRRAIGSMAALAGGGSVLAASFTGKVSAVPLLVASLVLGALYNVHLEFLGVRNRLKQIYVVKNLAPAVGWSLATIFYPTIHAGGAVTAATWLAGAYTLIGVGFVEVVWDFRDMAGDRLAHVDTLPIVLGTTKAKWALVGLVFLWLGLVIAAVTVRMVPAAWLLTLVGPAVGCVWLFVIGHRLREEAWSHWLIVIPTASILLLGALGRMGIL